MFSASMRSEREISSAAIASNVANCDFMQSSILYIYFRSRRVDGGISQPYAVQRSVYLI